MPRDGPPYVQVHKFPYDRENSLPTYEEATGIVPQRTHNEVALDIPEFSTHRWPIDNSNIAVHQHLYNPVQVSHVSSAAPRYENGQQYIEGNYERPNSKKDLLIVAVIGMLMIAFVYFLSPF